MWNTSTIALYTSLSSSVAKMPWVIIPKNSNVRTTDISWLVLSECVLCFVFSHDVSHTGYVLWILSGSGIFQIVRLKSKTSFLNNKFKNNIFKRREAKNLVIFDTFDFLFIFIIFIKMNFFFHFVLLPEYRLIMQYVYKGTETFITKKWNKNISLILQF